MAAAAAVALAAACPLVGSQAHATEATQAALNDAEARYYAALEQIDYLNNLVFDAEAVYDQPLVGSQAHATEATQAALNDAEARYYAALEQIDYLNNLVFDAEAVYDQISTDLYYTVQRIEELQASIAQRQEELAVAQDVLSDRLAANYRAGKNEMLDVLLSASSFDDFVSRLYYAGKVSDADAEAIQNVKDIKAALEADEAALQEQRVQQEQLQAEQAAQLEVLNAQVAAAEDYAASLDWEVQALRAQKAAEEAAIAEAARRAAAEQAAAEAGYTGGSIVEGDDGNYYYYIEDDSGSSDDGSGGGGSYVYAGSEAAAEAGYTGGSIVEGDDGNYYYYIEDDSGSSDDGSGGGGSYVYAGSDMSSAVANAYKYIGTPYSSMDCSGLTSTAYGDSGVDIYHQSGVQYNHVATSGSGIKGAADLNEGDLVFYERNGSIYHVGLYIGGGKVIDSIPNGGVQIRDLYYCDGFVGGGSV